MHRPQSLRTFHTSARAFFRAPSSVRLAEAIQTTSTDTPFPSQDADSQSSNFHGRSSAETIDQDEQLQHLQAQIALQRQAMRRRRSPSVQAVTKLEKLQLAYESRQLELRVGKQVDPITKPSRNPLYALEVEASRAERNIAALALMQLRRALISHQAREDRKTSKTHLPALSDEQRRVRQQVDRMYNDREHGKNIWIFCHLVTKQIIYSLENKLSQASLNKLTFVGKKSVPSSVRPDYWHCMAVVSFPNHFQGLHAYRCLNEYRLVHEHCWEPPKRPQTEGLEKFYHDPHDENTFALDESEGLSTSGSKHAFRKHEADHWEDMVASRRKKHALPKADLTPMLQNQRANAIADLAATLHLQQRKGADEIDRWQARWKEWDEVDAKTWKRIESLAELNEKGEMPILQSRIEDLEHQLETMADAEAQERMKKEVSSAKHELEMIKVAPAKIAQRDQRQEAMKSLAASYLTKHQWANVEKRDFVQEMMARMLYHYHFAVFSKELRPQTKKLKDQGGWRLKMLLDKLYPIKRSFFSMQGVEIRWADEIDIGVAESWPEGVTHIVAGQYLRYGAWHPEVLDQMEALEELREQSASA